MSLKHVHRYCRFPKIKTKDGKPLWRCMIPGCTHQLYGDEMMAGREGLCSDEQCDNVFRFPRIGLKALPNRSYCPECSEKRKEQWREERRDFIQEKERQRRLNSLRNLQQL